MMGPRRDAKFKDKLRLKIFNARLVILDSKHPDEVVKKLFRQSPQTNNWRYEESKIKHTFIPRKKKPPFEIYYSRDQHSLSL